MYLDVFRCIQMYLNDDLGPIEELCAIKKLLTIEVLRPVEDLGP
jgi:hypothetical protein